MTSEGAWLGRPPVTYVRLYADEDGESHFEQRQVLSETDSEVSGRGLLDEGGASSYSLMSVTPGWVRDWGPSKGRTLAVYVGGEGIVESSDGDRRRVGPGVVLLAEDTTGRGHRARVTGSEPLVVMHIVLRVSEPIEHGMHGYHHE